MTAARRLAAIMAVDVVGYSRRVTIVTAAGQGGCKTSAVRRGRSRGDWPVRPGALLAAAFAYESVRYGKPRPAVPPR
jgi:hypothetical protein